ncbi:uncharacterized protein LOC121374644 isoform X2 [Gigantopelta aegis]|uniref:uncharacterized protein LOC121374644 isoform X2 n=1 Tax=Gigantopelta aegis TaxID=1735272 RepID=UPI001B88D3A7|nr:uncharacterized protein LOC121374644 isoform X2 [Gigantopelta aegis]
MLTVVLLWFYFRDISYYFLDSCELYKKKKMAKSEIQRCLDWLFEQQSELEGASFGSGQSGVHEAFRRLESQTQEIKNFKAKIDKATKKPDVKDDDVSKLNGKYAAVESVVVKRASCLQVISQISSLEGLLKGLTTEFDQKVVHMVNEGDDKKQGSVDQTNESLARTAQNCIAAVRTNWRWIETVMKCSEVHLKNAGAFQEFFHEVDEAEYWMQTTLSRIHMSFDRKQLTGDRADVESIQREIKDVLTAYLQWQTKVDYLLEKTRQVVPVRQRVKKLDEPRPVLALADYKTNEIEFIEGETLMLMDNTKKEEWLVQNERGQTGLVPAVLVLIPAPAADAVDAAIKLRLQLLSLWTMSVKRLGYQLVAFMIIVFKDWSEDEVAVLQAMKDEDKVELLRILKYIEKSLQPNWSEYSDYQELEERMLRLKMILEESPAGQTTNDELVMKVIVQVKLLEQLLNKYRDFWAYWETFRVIVELLKQPKYLLVCNRWDELRYITTAHFVRFWDTELKIEDPKKLAIENIQKSESLTLHETPKEAMPASTDVVIDTEKEETTSEEVTTTFTEECLTYVIKSVVDPKTKREISLHDAVMIGLIDQNRGTYYNPVTRETMTVDQAINRQLVIMELVSTTKVKEEKQTFGLITITVTRETHPYTIKYVLDPSTEEKLAVSKAIDKGILDTNNGTYKTETGEIMAIADAISSGLIVVEYHTDEDGDGGNGKPEVVTKTYSVHGVVDQVKKDKVSFHEAVSQGLLDSKTGDYINNKTGVRVPVQEAIMKGFIKARIVTDPSKLDIGAENKIVIQKFESAKTKLLRSVKAVRAMKK